MGEGVIFMKEPKYIKLFNDCADEFGMLSDEQTGRLLRRPKEGTDAYALTFRFPLALPLYTPASEARSSGSRPSHRSRMFIHASILRHAFFRGLIFRILRQRARPCRAFSRRCIRWTQSQQKGGGRPARAAGQRARSAHRPGANGRYRRGREPAEQKRGRSGINRQKAGMKNKWQKRQRKRAHGGS